MLSSEPALREVAGDAGVYAEHGDYGAALERALAERKELSIAGLARAKQFTWEAAARVTAQTYRQVLGA